MRKPSELPSGAILPELKIALANERACSVRAIELIAQAVKFKTYVPEGYSSMFMYCIEELGLSEDAAGMRIAVARASLRFPKIIAMLAEGRLHLTGAAKIARHLTAENAEELLAAGERKSKRDIEAMLAARFPQADVPMLIRPLAPVPAPAATVTPGSTSATATEPDAIRQPTLPVPGRVVPSETEKVAPGMTCPPRQPIPAPAAERFAVQGTISEATRQKMRRVQDLLGYSVSPGDFDAFFAYMCEAAIEKLEKQKCAATSLPREGPVKPSDDPRHIPAAIVRQVWKRDAGRCTFISASGKRCCETKALEIHHVLVPDRGGKATLDNLALRCRPHNQYDAELTFGAEFMQRKREHARQTARRGLPHRAVACNVDDVKPSTGSAPG